VSWWWAGLPLALAVSGSGMLGAALLLLLSGQGLDDSGRLRWFEVLCWGLLAAGLLSLLVSLVQVFIPAWADGQVIARSGIPGRAVGNMRQPNHLASLLMWSCVAAAYLADRGRF
ncbi:pilin glycosylation ligase domain-containing protein, partial [Roseateles sp. GG27B]